MKFSLLFSRITTLIVTANLAFETVWYDPRPWMAILPTIIFAMTGTLLISDWLGATTKETGPNE